jgi:cell division protein FtsW
VRIRFEAEGARTVDRGDPAFLAASFLLAGMGLASLWSASAGYAISLGKNPGHFALRQLVFTAPSVLVFIIAALAPLDRVRSRIMPITLVALAALFLPFLPGLGENRNGASRWIDLGFTTFQPSEFWKLASIFYLAHILDRRGASAEDSGGSILPPLLLCTFGCIVVYLQNDFSTAVIIGLASTLMFWIAGAPVSLFLGLGAAGTALAAFSVLTSDFRLKRILAFLFPAYEPHGQGYQILGSIRAIRSGGFFGKGIGLGTMKLASIPEVQSDFVFAAYAEETGFVGVLGFFALWGFFGWRALSRAFAEKDRFRSFLGFGLASLLLIEVAVNVAVASGLVPATGIALPFFSAGGTSLLSTACACGLLYNLSRGREVARGAQAGAEAIRV